MDDDSITQDDDSDDDTTADDPCSESPSAVLCENGVATYCDECGHTTATDHCDTELEEQCCEGLGCAACCPGNLSCDGQDVVRCADDGQTWSVVETCEVESGFACQDGACTYLCGDPDVANGNRGCEFMAVDLATLCNVYPSQACGPTESWGIAVAVVNDNEIEAHVRFEDNAGGSWSTIESGTLSALDGELFQLSMNPVVGTGLHEGSVYRLVSSVPVFAYQFKHVIPISLNEASTLIPVASLSTEYIVKDWCCAGQNLVEEQQDGLKSQVTLVGIHDGTVADVTVTVATEDGTNIEAMDAGGVLHVDLDEGVVVQIRPLEYNTGLDGTSVDSDLPIAIFVSHPLAFVPPTTMVYGGGRVEEQLLGREWLSNRYVAGRIFPRNDPPDDAYWHAMALDDMVDLEFMANVGVNGLPDGNLDTILPGEVLEFYTDGTSSNPGDFIVTAANDFMLTQYMAGAFDAGIELGDACMVQVVPPEAFRTDYAVYTLPGWERHVLTITREADAPVYLDGLDVDTNWDPVCSDLVEGYQFLRVDVDAGPHFLTSSVPFGLIVAGVEWISSYCYLGGFE